LSAMLKAGIPILQSFEILRDQTEKLVFKNVLTKVSSSLTGGSRLSEALAEFPHVFSPEYVNIVISGETGGDLVQALSNMAVWLERELEMKTAIKSALRYPVMVIIALIAAAVSMVMFVVPRFAVFFAQYTATLPLPTRILLAANNIFQHYWFLLLIIIIMAAAAIFFLLRNPKIRLQYDKMKFHLKLIGPIYTKIMISHFARIFSILVRNGIPALKALEVAAEVVNNTYFKDLLLKVKEDIQGGGTIADGFFNNMPIFPPMVTNLIAVGEKTGSLDDMLNQVVDFYEMEINYTLKNLTAMIEPIITLVIGVGVLFLALAILLPVWNMSQVMTSQVK
jgi:MSHA biogenesis protein MshG